MPRSNAASVTAKPAPTCCSSRRRWVAPRSSASPGHFKGVPLLYNMAASGKTPDLPADELGRLGFKHRDLSELGHPRGDPGDADDAARAESEPARIAHMRDKVADFKEFTEIAGLPEIQELEARYGVPEDQRAGL